MAHRVEVVLGLRAGREGDADDGDDSDEDAHDQLRPCAFLTSAFSCGFTRNPFFSAADISSSALS